MRLTLGQVVKATTLSLVAFLFFFSYSFADVIDSVTNGSDDISVGNNYSIWWGYRPAAGHNICTVSLQIKKQGTPTDALGLELLYGTTTYPSFGSSLSGTLVKSADSLWQITTSAYSTYTFSFTPCVPVAGAYWYSFHLYRTGSLDASNYYKIQGSDSNVGTITGTGNWLFDRCLGVGTSCTFHANTTSKFNITLDGTENYGAVSVPTNGFAQTVVDQLLGINDTNASTSTASGIASFGNVPAYFARKVPFGYLYDIYSMWNNVSTSTASEFGAVTITFSSLAIATTTKSFLPPSITIFSTSTVTYYINGSQLDLLNLLASGAIAITWVMMLFRKTEKVIQPV